METLSGLIDKLNGIVWGPAMLVLILGTGLFLTIGLRAMPLRHLGYGFRMLWRGRRSEAEGDITPFNALMTSLSATIGTGNIAGVGTAIAIGGPGAVFWMWCTALVGMATKYAEAVLAVRYRELDEEGNHVGGPMYYIRNGLGVRWRWLAAAFALFGAFAGFGIGNMVQANSVADVMEANLGVPFWVTGVVMAVLVFLVLIGGIRRIAQVAGKLVPFMAFAYLAGGLAVILFNIAAVPAAFVTILEHAFTPTAAGGGFVGATVMLGIQMGVARGIFSNEAGLGSAPIAHAAAQTDDPVRQGSVAMLGTFIDTILVCTITALVIVISTKWMDVDPKFTDCVERGGAVQKIYKGDSLRNTECTIVDEATGNEKTTGKRLEGAALSSSAFAAGLPGLGEWVVTFGLMIFAFTTMLGWSVYGERCVEYLFGVHSILPFRILWVLAIPLGATVKLGFVWLVADTLNALMAIPNLIALLLLSPVVFGLTRAYFARHDVEGGEPAED